MLSSVAQGSSYSSNENASIKVEHDYDSGQILPICKLIKREYELSF